MKFEILHIEDTPDGGAIITIEADRNLLHYAFEKFVNEAIMDKVDEILNSQAEARTLVEEDGSAPIADSESKDLDQAVRGLDSGDIDWSGSFTYPHER
jgi:hypothetical protein